MKVTKRQLIRIIREEKRRMRESCGEDMGHPMDGPIEVVADVTATQPSLLESETPEQDMLVEMEVASRSLTQVVESVQNAAQLCSNCNADIADKAPMVEAMVAQAEALQEMLEAQSVVILENTDTSPLLQTAHETPVLDAIVDLVGS